MIFTTIDQFLQLLAWFLGLVELTVGLYVLVYNPKRLSNRYTSLFMIVFAITSFSFGTVIRAASPAAGQLPAALLSVTIPAMMPLLLMVTAALLKPSLLKSRFPWIPILAIFILLPAVLTVIDLFSGSGLWFTGLPEGYAGGYPKLDDFAQGSLKPVLNMILTAVFGMALIVLLVYLAFFDRRLPRTKRVIAILLLVSTGLIVASMLGLPDPRVYAATVLIASIVFSALFTYCSFSGMVSEGEAQRGRLQVRLTSLIAAIVLPLVAGLILITSDRAGQIIRSNATQQLEAANRSLSANITTWLELNVASLKSMALLPGMGEMDPEQQKPALIALTKAHPHMYLASTTDLYGMNVARSDEVANKNYIDREWFYKARVGAPVTFQIVTGRTSGQPALVVSTPIEDASGYYTGVAMFATDLTNVSSQVASLSMGESSIAFLVNHADQVIAHPNQTYTAEAADLSEYPPVKAMRARRQGTLSFQDETGQNWISSFSVLDNNWGLIVQQPESSLLAALTSLQRLVWILLPGGVVLLLLLTWLSIRQALVPIQNLTATARTIASGDLHAVARVESDDEIGELASTFNSMTEELRRTLEGLEQRVAERTSELAQASRNMEYRASQLQTVGEVARAVTSILDLDELLEKVTRLISERFDFYHAGIFLIDEDGEWAILRAANSEGGQRMLARGHRLRVGQVGIVGFATGTGQPRIALDVGEDATFFDNPDLPETRSEMALPLKIGDQVIGALDVQSTKPAAFTQEDVELLSTLADQVAVAIQNVRSFEETRRALNELKTLHSQYLRTEWTDAVAEAGKGGYQYMHGKMIPLLPNQSAGLWNEVNVNEPTVVITPDNGVPARASLIAPIAVRGEIIGMLDLGEPSQGLAWQEEDLNFIRQVADQIGQALENARLIEQTQRRAEREHLVSEITTRLRASNDPETILKVAADELRNALRANHTKFIIKERPETPGQGEAQPN